MKKKKMLKLLNLYRENSIVAYEEVDDWYDTAVEIATEIVWLKYEVIKLKREKKDLEYRPKNKKVK